VKPWVVPLLFLVACAEEDTVTAPGREHVPVPGCEAIDPAPCDVLARACQERLHAMAGCLREQDPGALPPIDVVSEAEYEESVFAGTNPRPDPDHGERAFVLFGLVEPGAFDPVTQAAGIAEFVAGVYDRQTKGITLIEHDQPLDEARASTVLVHEFVHALQDRDVDIESFMDAFATSVDTSIAARSMVEGEARLHETRYAAAALALAPGADLEERFDNFVALEEARYLESPSPYLAVTRAFPYAWGARYLHYLWRDGGMAAIDDAYAAPPDSTAQLMASESTPAEPLEVTLPELAEPPSEWELLASHTLGGMVLFVVLGQTLDIDRARELAVAWRGDGFGIYAEVESEETAAVWRIVMADAESAQAVADALGDAVVQGDTVVAARTTGADALEWAYSSVRP
jgi:hypothetical protein